MNRLFITISILLFSINGYGQNTEFTRTVSFQDSILLRNFWTEFTIAIEKKDKNKLAALCEFPFYCHPCIDDSTLKHNDHETIKVTRKLFFQSQYKVFFAESIKSKVFKYKTFVTDLFYQAAPNAKGETEYMFSYTIIPPSKYGEGSQGFIYIGKKRGRFKITGIDTVP